jgi:cytochrome P450
MVCGPLLGCSFPEQDIVDFLRQLEKVYFDLISRVEEDNINELRLDPASVALRESMEAIVDAALSLPEGDQSMIKTLQGQIAKNTTPEVGRSILRSLVIGTLAGSVDSVGAALLWTLIHLSRAPEARAGIAQEAKETGVDHWHIMSTPMACAAVRETFRLTPVQPLIERATATKVDVCGHIIEAGVNVLFSPWLVHRNAANWPNPLRYDIERFGPNQRIDPNRYFPFGIGKRSCVGMNLALHQLTFAVSKVCQNINFSLSDRCKPGHLKPLFRLLLWPRGPVYLDLAPAR